MKKISAEIVADSICNGHRITTMLLTYPRFIHSEVMTHRMFSRNSASSRAIPFEKMVKAVEEDPFIPIAWQKDHKGMQGTEYITDPNEVRMLEIDWYNGMYNAVQFAHSLHNKGLTKQLCNRLLEPFMWHTVLLTGTEFENFFNLRCPQYNFPDVNQENIFKSRKEVIQHFKDTMYFEKYWKEEALEIEWLQRNKSQAEIHIQALAEAMWDAMNESVPKELKAGEWHIPFGDKIHLEAFDNKPNLSEAVKINVPKNIIKVATARCARLSYMTFDNRIDYVQDVALHDRLLQSGHMSPMEHCARAMSQEEYESFVKGKFSDLGIMVDDKAYGWCNNFRGWIQYRYLIENE